MTEPLREPQPTIVPQDAGRELDELIAERVFGLVRGADFGERPEHEWVVAQDDEYNGAVCARCHAYESWMSTEVARYKRAGPCDRAPRAYSASVIAAWELEEKMRPHALHLFAPGALINDEFGEYSKGWTAQFVAWGKRAADGSVEAPNVPNWYGEPAIAETAPLAICLAALKAVQR